MIKINHMTATPPGFDVTVKVRLVEVDGKRLIFDFEANDGVALLCKGAHERFIINAENFGNKLAEKAKQDRE